MDLYNAALKGSYLYMALYNAALKGSYLYMTLYNAALGGPYQYMTHIMQHLKGHIYTVHNFEASPCGLPWF